VFVPKALVERIARNNMLISSANAVLKQLQKRGLECRFGDIREAHASVLTKHLTQPEIDFLHGRVGANVFMANYFNPALIADLKQRVFKAIAEIQTKIS
jgi:intergrase/recombinase